MLQPPPLPIWPQPPEGAPHGIDPAPELECECAANFDNCCSRSLPEHCGHSACCDPRTMASKRFPQPLQRYSKIGIATIPSRTVRCSRNIRLLVDSL